MKIIARAVRLPTERHCKYNRIYSLPKIVLIHIKGTLKFTKKEECGLLKKDGIGFEGEPDPGRSSSETLPVFL